MGAILLLSSCFGYRTVKPAELQKLNGAVRPTLERPDGSQERFSGRSRDRDRHDVRVRFGEERVFFSTPLDVELTADSLIIGDAQQAPRQFPRDEIEVSVRDFDGVRTGVLVGTTAAVVIAVVVAASEGLFVVLSSGDK